MRKRAQEHKSTRAQEHKGTSKKGTGMRKRAQEHKKKGDRHVAPISSGLPSQSLFFRASPSFFQPVPLFRVWLETIVFNVKIAYSG
jgi:hypothetical protein